MRTHWGIGCARFFSRADTTNRVPGADSVFVTMKTKLIQNIITPAIALIVSATSLQAGTQISEKRIHEPVATVAEGGPYWAIFGGANVKQSSDNNQSRGGVGRLADEEQNELGWFAGVKWGYDFASSSRVHFALEVEGLYSKLDAETESNDGGFSLRTKGDFSAAALMVNGLIKFEPIYTIRPYIGVGAGVAYVELQDVESEVTFKGTRLANRTQQDAEDWTFAYQGIAGLDFMVNERISIFTEYKALVFHDAVGTENYINHLVGIGVRVKY